MSTKRKVKRKPQVSLIIPAYNETVRLVNGVSEVLSYLTRKRYGWELIIVDDGSVRPATLILDEAQRKKTLKYKLSALPVHIVRSDRNMGKGAAVGLGMSRARGEMLVFCDVDLSVPIAGLPAVLSELKHHQVVVASRRLAQSHILVHQSKVREFGGRIFTWISNIICQTAVSDITCGFKGFRRPAALALFGLRRIDRWVFDAEIIFLAKKYGVPVKEIPVAWTNKSGSKVRPMDGVQSFIDLLRIRWHDVRGLYEVRPL